MIITCLFSSADGLLYDVSDILFNYFRLPQCAECGKIKCMMKTGDCIVRHPGHFTTGGWVSDPMTKRYCVCHRSRSVIASQVLRKTQVPPSGPQSCRHGVQEGLILREAASCCKLESQISICSPGAALAARVLQKFESRISNEWLWVRDLAAPVLH